MQTTANCKYSNNEASKYFTLQITLLNY